MNRFAWMGIIVWGMFLAACGLAGAGPLEAAAPAGVQPQDVMFLLAGGLFTCMIGVAGLLGCMGWIPGLGGEKKTCV